MARRAAFASGPASAVCRPRSSGYRGKTIGWGPYPAYIRAALLSAYENIAGAPIGQQDVTLIREAFSIGTLVGAGAMPRTLAIDMLVDAGLQMTNAPGRRSWCEREIRDKVDRSVAAGEHHPRAVAA